MFEFVGKIIEGYWIEIALLVFGAGYYLMNRSDKKWKEQEQSEAMAREVEKSGDADDDFGWFV